jgi:hypothetical protein
LSEIAGKTDTMFLARYYKRIVLLPTLLIVVGFVGFIIYDQNFGTGTGYQTNGLTVDPLDPIVIGAVAAHCLIVCALCLSIFFNRRAGVSGNTGRSFLSWFLLPYLYFGYQLYRFFAYGASSALFIAAMTLPYLISLNVTFFQFRQALKAKLRYPRAGR